MKFFVWTAVSRNENVAKCQRDSPRPLNFTATGSRDCSQLGKHRIRHDSWVLRCGTTSHAVRTPHIGWTSIMDRWVSEVTTCSRHWTRCRALKFYDVTITSFMPPKWQKYPQSSKLFAACRKITETPRLTICNTHFLKNNEELKTNFESVKNLLGKMIAHWEEGGGRILLDDNTGGGAVMLRSIRFQCGSVDFISFQYIYIYIYIYTGLFISPSGTSELDCATTKTDTAERSISIGRESLKDFFLY